MDENQLPERVKHVKWYTSRNDTIGIVFTENETKERKIYTAKVTGDDAYNDICYIRDYGAKITLAQVNNMFEFLTNNK